jgi:hypothetical protein
LKYEILLHFKAIWNILWPFGIIYSLLAYIVCVVIWYIFSVLVCLDQEKSGNSVHVYRNDDEIWRTNGKCANVRRHYSKKTKTWKISAKFKIIKNKDFVN